MISMLIFIACTVLFICGSYADAASSAGMLEQTKLYQNAEHRFDPRRYSFWMAGFFAACFVFGLIFSFLFAGLPMVVMAVRQFRQATKNNKLREGR